MKLQGSSATVMENACGALANISAYENNIIIIAKEGGIPIVLNVMNLHSSNVPLMQICKHLLYVLKCTNNINL